jgi:hypothetical protein
MNTTIARGANGYSLPNTLDISLIAPQRGSKYSPNLYDFLKAKKSTASMARVYSDKEGTLWIGFFDDTDSFIGQRLSQVLSYGKKSNLGSYSHIGGHNAFVDELTEQVNFWDEYVADGRCALDREHDMPFIGSDTRWSISGETRHCKWCNKASQRLRSWTETVTRQRWETV